MKLGERKHLRAEVTLPDTYQISHVSHRPRKGSGWFVKVDLATREKLIEIGSMIRAARERAELSQASVAARIGMARENYLRIEKGRANLTVETLMRIGHGLGLDLSVAYSAKTASNGSASKPGNTKAGARKRRVPRRTTKRRRASGGPRT